MGDVKDERGFEVNSGDVVLLTNIVPPDPDHKNTDVYCDHIYSIEFISMRFIILLPLFSEIEDGGVLCCYKDCVRLVKMSGGEV